MLDAPMSSASVARTVTPTKVPEAAFSFTELASAF